MNMEYLKKFLIAFFLSATLVNSVFKMGKNYYPEMALGKCKYIDQEKKSFRGRSN